MSAPEPISLADILVVLFPWRDVTVRAGEGERRFVFSPGRQAAIALAVTACLIGFNVSVFAVVGAAMGRHRGEETSAVTSASSADHLTGPRDDGHDAISPGDSGAVLAEKIERRHAALALLLSEARNDPAAAAELQPAFPALTDPASTPGRRIAAIVDDQDRLVRDADTFAKDRAKRLNGALAIAGLSLRDRAQGAAPLHDALITAYDAHAIAGELKVDINFARRVRDAASSLFDLRDLRDRTDRLPLAHPVDRMTQSSGFGSRRDPINGFAHFHAGLDFPGPALATIHATAPGTVVFAGARSGYGDTVEIDHGGGVWTRYAHLSEIDVAAGDRVDRGDRIGGMGSTGHSTGTHLHYEIWRDGRPQDPMRFLRAGEFIARTD